MVDFIKSRNPAGPSAVEQGSFITPMPDYDADNDGVNESAKKWDGAGSNFDSFSTQEYPDGFELEFDYAFDKSRGDGTFGYVQAYRANGNMINKKLSFVGNSGVKFGDKPCEAAIIDNDSFNAMAGGINVGHLTDYAYPAAGSDGKADDVHVTGCDPESLNRLMTGIKYGGDYDFIADTSFMAPLSVAGFFTAHTSNLARANSNMKLVIGCMSPTGFLLQVSIGGQLVCDESLGTSIAKFSLQSHWGSGVVFSNMKIKALT